MVNSNIKTIKCIKKQINKQTPLFWLIANENSNGSPSLIWKFSFIISLNRNDIISFDDKHLIWPPVVLSNLITIP